MKVKCTKYWQSGFCAPKGQMLNPRTGVKWRKIFPNVKTDFLLKKDVALAAEDEKWWFGLMRQKICDPLEMLDHLKIKNLWPGYHQTMLIKVAKITRMVAGSVEEYYFDGDGRGGALKRYIRGQKQ